MGIFYTPPPVQGRTSFTPPEPHAPIGTQGSQPPRFARANALMLVAVLASWPQDLEPRLGRPNEQQQKIAPLTLTYGQQPKPQGPLTVPELTKLLRAWPLDVGPLLPRPDDERVKIAPLTFTYGSQPRPNGPLSVPELTKFLRAWESTWDAQTAPKSAAWNVPIVTVLPYRPLPQQIVTAWEPRWIAPPPLVEIAPLTLTYASPPVPHGPLTGPDLTTFVLAWQQTWGTQTASKSAAWNVPGTFLPSRLFPRQILTAWEPVLGPPPPRVAIAPLMLGYGTPPVPQAPLSPTVLGQILRGWPLAIGPVLPWQPPPSVVSRFAAILEPPRQPPLSAGAIAQIVGTWPQTWDAQGAAKNAAVNQPPPVVVVLGEIVDGVLVIRQQLTGLFAVTQTAAGTCLIRQSQSGTTTVSTTTAWPAGVRLIVLWPEER